MILLTVTACGKETPGAPEGAGTVPAGEETAQEAAAATEVPEYVYDEDASITFADGKFGFLGSDTSVNPTAKESVFELVERDGHNAVKVTSSQMDKIYVGIQMDALLGEDVGKAASVEIGIETQIEGGFVSTAGNISSFIGGVQKDTPWSVYLENKDPKTIVAEIPEGAARGDYLVLSLDDSATDFTGVTLYIHTISFKDRQGNVLAADSSARYVSLTDGGFDRSNLFGLTRVTTVGNPAKNTAWAQSTIIPDLSDPAVAELLVPGSVVEISYKSETGNLWVVLPGAASWSRVGVGDRSDVGEEYAYINASHNIVQVTYEQIAAVCGEDLSGWGPRMEAESDGEWEVFSVRIGMAAPNYGLTDYAVVGQEAAGEAWEAADIIPDLTDPAVAEVLVPGSVIEITYASETGELWIVLPDDGNRTRVGAGEFTGDGQDYAVCDGNKCYIPFEMIAAIEGTEDVSAWGERLQAEASTAWEVYGVRIGTAAELLPTNHQVEAAPGKAEGGGWEAGEIIADLSDPAIAEALVPGSVINISYSSDSDVLWIVLPDDGKETRIGVGMWDGSGNGYSICNGRTCQIPFETIAQIEGTDDVSAWGTRILAESNAAWEVKSVTIGTVR